MSQIQIKRVITAAKLLRVKEARIRKQQIFGFVWDRKNSRKPVKTAGNMAEFQNRYLLMSNSGKLEAKKGKEEGRIKF
jgi:hypothetical protein